jgi:phytoene dehydrogenase-like protein
MAHPLPDGTAVALHRDVRGTADSLERQHGGDGESWAQFVSPYVRAFDAVRATILGGFPPVDGSWNLLGRAGSRATVKVGLLLARSAVGLGRSLFAGQGSRAWLYGTAAHGDAPVSARGSAMAAFYLSLLGHGAGWPSPRGGAERLTDALVSYLTRLGGTIETGARVQTILSRGGHVTGVAVADGAELPATHVLADVMPRALLAMTGDALAPWYRRLLAGYRYGPATVKVDWALDGPIPWTAPDARRAGTVHVGGGEKAMTTSLDESQRGLAERPFLLVGQQTIADSTRAPEGRHTAWAYTHAPARMSAQLSSEGSVRAIEDQVARFAPGFRDLILARHVLGPAQLQERNANLVHGDVGGGSYRGLQAVFRPVPSLSPYRTPLRGLFLASAATFPGGAVHGVPGDAAARAALASQRFG